MDNQERMTFSCPTCGRRLEQDGRLFHCEEHGMWQRYSATLLVHLPSEDSKVRDRFTMPWEAVPQAV